METVSRAELIEVIVELRRQVEQLRRENEELRRGQGGSAAPFSRGTHKANPKSPGRKPGEGPFLRRKEPAEAGAETIAAPVEACCPYCSGVLEPDGTEFASVTDIEEIPRPVVKRYEVEVCHCLQCGRKVRGRHADLAAGQFGATAHRPGPRVKAAAHALHFNWGVPLRKVPAILKELTGIEVTQSAITQDALKRAEGLVGQAYEQLRAKIKEASFVHTDDTGWRTAGEAAQLMVFETDREKSYDAEELSGVAQQKCLSHLIRNASAVVNKKSGPARQFGIRLKELLRGSIQLWRENKQGDVPDYKEQVEKIEAALTHHLRNRVMKDDDNQRLLNGIGGQNDRGNVLRFLHEPGVEPTDNRALRPAVIARKVSQCSKNERGAHAFAAFISPAQTFRKNPAVSVTQAFLGLFRNGTSTAASL